MGSELDEDLTIDFERLRKLLSAASAAELPQEIVNAPFEHNRIEAAFLFLGIVVLLLVDPKKDTIDRIALSDTELASRTTKVSAVPFEEIRIPLKHPENIIAKAIRTNEPQDTTDWKFLFEPALKPDQARINQASAGIAYSAVYPLQVPDGGALIFSYFQYQQAIGKQQQEFMENYSSLVSDALSKTA